MKKVLLLIASVMLWAMPALATVAFVNQSSVGAQSGTGPLTCSDTLTLTSGNLAVLTVVDQESSGTASIASVSDGVNTWHLATKVSQSAVSEVEIWYAANVASGSTTVVSTNNGQSGGTMRCLVSQFSGASTIVASCGATSVCDQTATSSSNTAVNPVLTGTTSTVSQSNEVAVGIISNSSGSISAVGGTIGTWTALNSSGVAGRNGYDIGGSVGTYGGQIAVSSAYAGAVVTFQGPFATATTTPTATATTTATPTTTATTSATPTISATISATPSATSTPSCGAVTLGGRKGLHSCSNSL